MLFRSNATAVLALLSLTACTLPEAVAAPALLLDSATAKPREQVVLTLRTNNDVQDLSGLMLTVRFEEASPANAPRLEFVNPGSQRLGPAFTGSLYGSATPRDPETGLRLEGQHKIAIVHAEPLEGALKVIELPFTVPAGAPAGAAYTVRVTAVANDSYGVKFDMEAVTSAITVTGAPPLPVGDVNGNGRVEVSDVILILRGTLNLIQLTPEQIARGDFNKNGRLEVADAVGVLRIAVRLGGA